MQLCHKQKAFSGIFFAVLKFVLNFEKVFKNNDPPTWCIYEITDSEKRSKIIV